MINNERRKKKQEMMMKAMMRKRDGMKRKRKGEVNGNWRESSQFPKTLNTSAFLKGNAYY